MPAHREHRLAGHLRVLFHTLIQLRRVRLLPARLVAVCRNQVRRLYVRPFQIVITILRTATLRFQAALSRATGTSPA
jgi:hypothetical protein